MTTMTALDTNIVIDLGAGTSLAADAALRAIESASRNSGVVICAAVYAELRASPAVHRNDIDEVLRLSGIAIDTALALDVWAHAGVAFGAYACRRKASGAGIPRRILADFLIGAHAYAVGSLVTRDAAFYRRAFPELRVVEVR